MTSIARTVAPRGAWAFAFLLAAFAGCAGGADAGGDAVAAGDGPLGGDLAIDAGRDAGAGRDGFGAPDAPDAGATDAAAAPDGLPPPGEFGAPCSDNAECIDGYCVEGYAGRVCTRLCLSKCPDGWSCEQDLAAVPDVIYLCVPSFLRLCYPCTTNDDCREPGAAGPHACIPRGAEGAFCGGACERAACPPGYVCALATDVTGAESPQCQLLAAAGSDTPPLCDCAPGAVAAAAHTACFLENAAGRCAGRRECTADGLSACDAPTPAPDLCDGVDNDCDGPTDEAHLAEPCERANEHGRCAGEFVCGGAAGPSCSAPEPAGERCDGADNDCDGETDEADAAGCTPHYFDLDGDGYGTLDARCLCAPAGDYAAPQGGDCADDAPLRHPQGLEVCNGLDDNCDGAADEDGAAGCGLFSRDGDGDGFGHPTDLRCLCAAEGDYAARSNTDCDDAEPAAHPGGSETCDGVDNDCDGLTDEDGSGNCTLHFADGDGDGHGNGALYACLCAASEAFPTTLGGDCADADPARHPGAAERCDGVDNDCDGLSDESGAADCTPYYRDGDGDAVGVQGDVRCACGPLPPHTATVAGDCNDAVASVYPGAAEACNGLDDDCDGTVDEADAAGCAVYFLDADRDSHGVATDARCLCVPVPPYVARVADDCDDGNPFAHPGAHEVCNGIDDDCNGDTDEGVQGSCVPFYLDADADGWGQDGDSQCLCGPAGLYRAARPGDCDDADPSVYPFAPEVCNDGRNDDCDALGDEPGALGCLSRYRDDDGDDYGQLSDFQCLCAPADPYRALGPGDCDDAAPAIHPAADETCDGLDNDCDGATDEPGATACTPYLRDSDGDGFGAPGDGQCLCAPAAPFVAEVGGDCNDANFDVRPGAGETCNGLDDDCNGVVDDPGTVGCTIYYGDADGDGFGAAAEQACLCGPQGTLRATVAGDCADTDPERHPAAIERCDTLDNDCDDAVDELGAIGCDIYYLDADADGSGVAGDFRCLCAAAGEYRTRTAGDCDDAAAAVYPGAPERCGGGDEDCDGTTDEPEALGCGPYLRDGDEDGYGPADDARCLCAPAWPYTALAAGDCNDSSDLIFPGQTEYCNATDDDCDGSVDEEGAVGCTDYFVDGDDDGWGLAGGRCLCAAAGAYRAPRGGDCADDDFARNPGVAERCESAGVDDDCDGATDEVGAAGCAPAYVDADGDGYGVSATGQCRCTTPPGQAPAGGDCADADPAIHPAAAEVCNARDDNCDAVFDEGCGLATGPVVWPTYKYDSRRSGHSPYAAGPRTAANAWVFAPPDGQLNTWSTQNSPVIAADGHIIVQVREWVYKLDRPTGAIRWKHAVSAAPMNRAGPTLREGGLLVVPAGNGLALLRPFIDPGSGEDSVETLWEIQFPGASSDVLTGSPMVDAAGNAYVGNSTQLFRVGPGGTLDWSQPVPNSQQVPADMAIGPPGGPGAGRLYFACTNHTIYAIEPDGQVAWTHFVPGADIDASVAVDRAGRIFLVYGATLVGLVDQGTTTAELPRFAVSYDTDTSLSIYFDGTTEWFFVNPNAQDIYRLRLLASGSWCTPGSNGCWIDSSILSHGSRGSTPIVDGNGVLYVGASNAAYQLAAIDLRVASPTPHLFEYAANGVVDGAVAVGQGFVVFSDNTSRVHCLGCRQP